MGSHDDLTDQIPYGGRGCRQTAWSAGVMRCLLSHLTRKPRRPRSSRAGWPDSKLRRLGADSGLSLCSLAEATTKVLFIFICDCAAINAGFNAFPIEHAEPITPASGRRLFLYLSPPAVRSLPSSDGRPKLGASELDSYIRNAGHIAARY